MHRPLDKLSDLTDCQRRLYYRWRTARSCDLPPALSALEMQTLGAGLDALVMTEILHDADARPTDFRFLYVGRAIAGVLRTQPRGRRISDDPNRGPGSRIWAAYMAVAADPRPHLVSLPYEGPDPAYSSTSELFLPLRDEEGVMRFILVGIELRGRDNRPAIPGDATRVTDTGSEGHGAKP